MFSVINQPKNRMKVGEDDTIDEDKQDSNCGGPTCGVDDRQHWLHMGVLAQCNYQVVSDSWGDDMDGANDYLMI
jgi:hypothetical protein